MNVLVTVATTIVTPAALMGVINLYLKITDDPRKGWAFKVERGPSDDDLLHPKGRLRADVEFRPIGGADFFEVRTRVWGKGLVRENREYTGKMTCESDPLKVTVMYRPGEAPWVGAFWIRQLRHGGQMQEAVQVNVDTGEYRRFKWHKIRNWFRFTRAPKGHWHTVKTSRPRAQFHVPMELEGQYPLPKAESD
jgi:hypothetical protein